MQPENGAGNKDNKLSRPGDEDASAGIQVSWPRKNIDLICNDGGAIACPGGKIYRTSKHLVQKEKISPEIIMRRQTEGESKLSLWQLEGRLRMNAGKIFARYSIIPQGVRLPRIYYGR
ncbi:hypothetical protein BS47DRAFT_1347141 [Hydnum rufescens UP504]|uniref:Uncharacterized protein n=1 Tax=Hydnum rufescens UP504 TaxID=1448309 RepID=A0A9P6ASJ5_9AGAM|nr:hypothetical protein BS47DRAFT_1347141 [Hydnum rufescens UP504]